MLIIHHSNTVTPFEPKLSEVFPYYITYLCIPSHTNLYFDLDALLGCTRIWLPSNSGIQFKTEDAPMIFIDVEYPGRLATGIGILNVLEFWQKNKRLRSYELPNTTVYLMVLVYLMVPIPVDYCPQLLFL